MPITKTKPKTETRLVRIHPQNPTRGYHCATYLLSGTNYPEFRVERGWYEVDLATARRLSQVRNNSEDPTSRPVFQVCTREEAIQVDEAEIQRVAAAEAPVPMPSARGGARRANSFISKGAAAERAKASRGALAGLTDEEEIEKPEEGAEEEAFDATFDDNEDLAEQDHDSEHAGEPVANEPEDEPVSQPGSGDLTTADLAPPVPAPRQGTPTKPVPAVAKAPAVATKKPAAKLPNKKR